MRFVFGVSLFILFASLVMGISHSHHRSQPSVHPFDPSRLPAPFGNAMKVQNDNERLEYSMKGIRRWNTITNVSTGALLNIPPRKMWGWGEGLHGYCGEASVQSVGIYYGNYISQEEVRYADGNEEFLVAVNDETAAKALKYQYTEWDYNQKEPQQNAFTRCLISQLDNGIPVIAGWYERQPKGDPDYDHIMPIIGYTASSDGELTGVYHNDFYLQEVSYTKTSDPLFATRRQCSQTSRPVQPFDYCLPAGIDYALTITNIIDNANENYRTMLEIDRWDEPDWGAEDGLHQQPVLMGVKAHVGGLTVGRTYAVLRFDDAKAIPSKGFLSGSFSKKYEFTATAPEMTIDSLDQIMSDSTSFFRTVLVD